MKKRVFVLVSVLLGTSLSIIGSSQANASECSASDPCGTWAMLDTQGLVTNVIVCQASVCGSGTWAGQTVVPQVAPNPVTHDTTGQGSYIGNSENNTSVSYSNGSFIINENSTIYRSETENNIADNSIETISVEIPVTSTKFTYNDTIGRSYGTVPMSVNEVDSELPTKISANKNINNENINESTIFYGKKTDQQVIDQIIRQQLNLINSKIQSLMRLLSGFIK
jgi:hypothetical protein